MQVSFSNGTMLRISPTLVRESAERLRQLGFCSESGGVLIGVRVANEVAYELRRITYPGLQDERSPFSFLRSKTAANRILRKRWAFSNGQENYLGEWHTHNEESPIPSTVDIKLMEQMVEDGISSFDAIFMLIIGNSEKAYIEVVHRDGTGIKREGKVVSWRA